jgi:hypothetical protein
MADMRHDMPLFWDDALVFRYLPVEPMARLRDDPGYEALREAVDRSWGV